MLAIKLIPNLSLWRIDVNCLIAFKIGCVHWNLNASLCLVRVLIVTLKVMKYLPLKTNTQNRERRDNLIKPKQKTRTDKNHWERNAENEGISCKIEVLNASRKEQRSQNRYKWADRISPFRLHNMCNWWFQFHLETEKSILWCVSIMEPCTFFVHCKADRIKFLVLSVSANKLIGLSEELKVLFCKSVSVDVSCSFIYDTKQTEIKQTSHAPERFWLTSAHLTPQTQRQRCQKLSYFKSANGLMTHRPSRLPIHHKKIFWSVSKANFSLLRWFTLKKSRETIATIGTDLGSLLH